VAADGTITTAAGNGAYNGLGDGGPATAASVPVPSGVAIHAGTLYIASGSGRIRKVAINGTITTVAGNGVYGFSGDGGQATAASLSWPHGITVDTTGNLYIADIGTYHVRKVAIDGIISTIAGNGFQSFGGDGGAATAAFLSSAEGIALDASGNLYIADTYNYRIRKMATDGTITTVGGGNFPGFSGDGGPATAAALSFPSAIAVHVSGDLYITVNNRIRKVTTDGTITTIAGNGTPGFGGDNGPATGATLAYPSGIAVDGSGNLYIADSANNRIRKIAANGTITTVAGSGTAGFGGDGGPATAAMLYRPLDIAVDGSGTLYIVDAVNRRIRRIAVDGTITTVAGNGISGSSGDGGPATAATLDYPTRVAVDGSGNLYVSDELGHRIRRVAAGGTITTIAGNGTEGFTGDGGPATAGGLSSPSGIAVRPVP